MVYSNFLLAALMGIIGLLMIVAAQPIVQALVVVIGVSALLSGFITLSRFSRLIEDSAFKTQCLIRGITSITVGLACVILPLTVAQMAWQIMIYIAAGYCIISVILETISVMKLYSNGITVKKYIFEIFYTLLLAMILFALPSSIGFIIIRIGGVILLLCAIFIAISAYRKADIIIEDAEVTDDDGDSE